MVKTKEQLKLRVLLLSPIKFTKFPCQQCKREIAPNTTLFTWHPSMFFDQFILKTVLSGIFLPLQGSYSQIFNIPQSDNLSILQRLGQLTIRFCCPRYLHMKDIQNKLQSGLPKRKGFLAIRKNTYHTTICAFCRVFMHTAFGCSSSILNFISLPFY